VWQQKSHPYLTAFTPLHPSPILSPVASCCQAVRSRRNSGVRSVSVELGLELEPKLDLVLELGFMSNTQVTGHGDTHTADGGRKPNENGERWDRWIKVRPVSSSNQEIGHLRQRCLDLLLSDRLLTQCPMQRPRGRNAISIYVHLRITSPTLRQNRLSLPTEDIRRKM
jgi:hypothetical protein